jgi:hypothetical protein
MFIPALAEEEKALLCILTDPAGIDLAEFAWVDYDTEDYCWRARPYQWMWWRNRESRQVDLCGRDLGKSLGTAMRTCTFPFRRPGQQKALVAPEKNHLDLLTGVIERRLQDTWITRQMMKPGRQAITHQPFEIEFRNGATVVGRIPNRDGRGVKGIHCVELELDEAQDLTVATWKELIETVKRSVRGFRYMVHGVTKGVHDEFYRITQPHSGWTVHRRIGMDRPSWSQEEREQKIAEYGGYDSPDFKRNVLGLHGDQTSPIFPLAALMACVDDDELSDYNVNEYRRINITGEEVGPLEGDILNFLDFPASHLAGKYERFWIGMDVGVTIHPSEILIFGEYKGKGRGEDSTLRLILRVHMMRVKEPDQADVVRWLIEKYKPAAFAMDSTGIGHPIYSELKTRQERATLRAEQDGDTEEAVLLRRVLDSIKGYGFGSKVPVGILDPTTEDQDLVDPDADPVLIMRNVKEAATDMLRTLVDTHRLELPWDREGVHGLLGQFQGQTFSNMKTGVDEYGRTRRFSEGVFHALDASRMAAMAFVNYKLEMMLKDIERAKLQKPPEIFLSFIGGAPNW